MARTITTYTVRLSLWIGWLLAGLSISGMAQPRTAQFEFRHIQERDGLSINVLNCFLQDRDGFLWIGTFDGLNRYDGDQFVVFKHQNTNPHSLLNNTVHALCEDKQGNIWMAVENGISCYEKVTGRFRNISQVNGRPLQMCGNILCDRNGDIWFTSLWQGLFRYVMKQGIVESYSPVPQETKPSRMNRMYKNAMLLDPHQNRIWLATAEGAGYFDIDRHEFFNYRHNPQRLPIFNNHYTSGLALDGDRLLFADNAAKEIIVYDLKTRTIVKTIIPVTTNERGAFDIATIFVDGQHNLWISSWNYVVLYVEANTYRITELVHDDANSMSIASNFFWGGWQHPDGSVWLGTVNGISYTNPKRAFYAIYNLENLFPALSTEWGLFRFWEDPDGSWWLGSHLRGLLHYAPQTNRLKVYKLPDASAQLPYGDRVSAILPNGNDLFVATQTGLYTFTKESETFRTIPLPADWPPGTQLACALLNRNQVWIGTSSGLVFSYSPQTGQWANYPVSASPTNLLPRVQSLMTDNRGGLWADVIPGGFARFDRQLARFVIHSPNATFSQNVANTNHSCAFDSAGTIWKATNGFGLWRYNPQKQTLQNWTESDGLAYDRASGVMPDRLGHIWVASYNKFSVFTPAQNRFLRFTLPINEANLEYDNYLFRLRNGHILALLKGYMVEFFPEKLQNLSVKEKEKVLISRVETGDTTLLIHRGLPEIHLKAEDNSFTIHFSALVPNQNTSFQYFYQLGGFDEWKRADTKTYAVYSKLPGGAYTFRVKAITPSGQETPVQSLVITIARPFYQAAWFWLLLLVGGLGLGGGFLRHQTRQTAQIHRLQVQATRLERDKTEIQYQNLINHLNPHFLFNSLTSLNSLIASNPREASGFLRKLSVIYRYILQNKDRELVNLSEELNFVQHYIGLQTTRFGDGIRFDITVRSADYTCRIVPVTLQNLFENAIKHNTLSDESPLLIRVYSNGESLFVANNLQRKRFVETSNKQGLASLQSLYRYLSRRAVEIRETETEFIISIPLLSPTVENSVV